MRKHWQPVPARPPSFANTFLTTGRRPQGLNVLIRTPRLYHKNLRQTRQEALITRPIDIDTSTQTTFHDVSGHPSASKFTRTLSAILFKGAHYEIMATLTFFSRCWGTARPTAV